LRKYALLAVLLAALFAIAPPPAFGVSRETLEILQRLEAMAQAMQNLQKTVDTQTAVLRTLVEQTNDNVNTMKASVADLRKATQENLAANNARFDSMTAQLQALSENLELTKERLAKLSEQVAQTQNIIQTLNAPPAPAPGTPGATPEGGPGKPANVPDADTLYKSALSEYNSGQSQLSVQEVQQYVQY